MMAAKYELHYGGRVYDIDGEFTLEPRSAEFGSGVIKAPLIGGGSVSIYVGSGIPVALVEKAPGKTPARPR